MTLTNTLAVWVETISQKKDLWLAWIQIFYDCFIRFLHRYTIRWYGPFIKSRNGYITMTWSIKPHYQGVHWQWCRIWTCSTIGYLNGVPLPSWVDRGYRGVLGVLRCFSRLLVGYWACIHHLPSFNSTPHELSAPLSSPSWTVFYWNHDEWCNKIHFLCHVIPSLNLTAKAPGTLMVGLLRLQGG